MQERQQRLEEIQIKEPCPADWNQMEGSDERRYCDQCDLHVQNLSAMPRLQAEATLNRRAQGEKLCVRVEYLPGGECVTAETPTRMRTGPGRIAAAALALGASLAACNSPEPAEPSSGESTHGASECHEEGVIFLGSTFSDWNATPEDKPVRRLGEVEFNPEEHVSELQGDVCPEEVLRPTVGEVCPPNVTLGTPGPLPTEQD